MGDRTFHIRQVWSSAIAIEIEISDMGSEMREKHGETMGKQGEARKKVESAKRAKMRGGESGSRSADDSDDPSAPDQTRLPRSREDLVLGDVGSQHSELIDVSHRWRHEMAMDKEP